MFGIFASIADFERELIRDRVRSGLRNAKAKEKHLGRPKIIVDVRRIAALRDSGASWPDIAAKLGVGLGTAYHAYHSFSKIPSAAGNDVG